MKQVKIDDEDLTSEEILEQIDNALEYEVNIYDEDELDNFAKDLKELTRIIKSRPKIKKLRNLIL